MGIVAVTKCDLVDDEWLQMVMEDIKTTLQGKIDNLSIIPVSATTGEGMNQLVKQIETIVYQMETGEASTLFRLPVDRVFSVTGYGTVVTGTSLGGTVQKGDLLEILPKGHKVKVRNIQVHGENMEIGQRGQRCALNVTGIETSQVSRGDVIVFPDTVQSTKVVDAVLFMGEEQQNIKHNQRVHVHIGTKQVLARVRIIGQETIQSGQKGYAQLRFEEPVVVLRGDRFIIRSYSPVKTIGGGQILLHDVPHKSRFLEDTIKSFQIAEQNRPSEMIHYILSSRNRPWGIRELWKNTLMSESSIEQILKEQIDKQTIIELHHTRKYISNQVFERYVQKIQQEFKKLYKVYPFRFQMDKEEVRSKVFSYWEEKDFMAFIDQCTEKGLFNQQNNSLFEMEKDIAGAIECKKEVIDIKRMISNNGLMPKKLQQIEKELGIDHHIAKEVMDFLIKRNKAIDLKNGLFIHSKSIKRLMNELTEIFKEQESVTIAQIRDKIKSSRIITIALMEYMDEIEFTCRIGDQRYPGKKFK
jgi:selenocysteine-specific elongation factor